MVASYSRTGTALGAGGLFALPTPPPRAREAPAERAPEAVVRFPTLSLRNTCSGRSTTPSDGAEERPLVALRSAISRQHKGVLGAAARAAVAEAGDQAALLQGAQGVPDGAAVHPGQLGDGLLRWPGGAAV